MHNKLYTLRFLCLPNKLLLNLLIILFVVFTVTLSLKMSAIKKVIHGSFHQGNPKFGNTSGKQCTCCSLFSVAFTLVKSPGYWDGKDIDFILENGDMIYKALNTNEYLMFTDLPRKIELFDSRIDISFLQNHFGIVNACSIPGSLFKKQSSSESDGLLLLIQGLCVSVVWTKKNFYLFDSHSKNEKGETCPDGSSVFLKFNSKNDLESHILKYYVTKDNGDIQFEMNTQSDFSSRYLALKDRNRKATNSERAKCRKRMSTDIEKEKCRKRMSTDIEKEKCRKRMATDIEKEKCRKRMSTDIEKEKSRNRLCTDIEKEKCRKRKATHIEKEKCRKRKATNTQKLKCKKRVASHRAQEKIQKANINSSISYSNRISCFKTAVREGPYYVCVICNRCLYKRTVKLFHENEYELEFSNWYTIMQSFDSSYYICFTCDRHLSKKQMPCQAVWNKLQLDDLPEEIAVLNRLETSEKQLPTTCR